MSEKKKHETYLFRYTGDHHNIDLNTLLVTQFHYLEILKELSRKYIPNNELKVTVNAFHKKSFGIEQVLEIVTFGMISFPSEFRSFDLLFQVFQDYISIKNLLGNEKAENIVEINNKLEVHGNGNTVIVHPDALQLYKDSTVLNEALKKSGEALSKDEEIDGIEISQIDSNKPLVKVNRDDFPRLAEKNAYLSEQDEKVEPKEDQVLYVKKFDIDPSTDTSFTFIYKERKISGVKIKDERFIEEIKGGRRFGRGDALRVDLEIVKKKDKAADIFVEDRYRITNVKQIIRRDETGDLFS